MPKGKKCTLKSVRCCVCNSVIFYLDLTRERKQRAREDKNLTCSERCLRTLRNKAAQNRKNMFGKKLNREEYQKKWLKINPEKRILHQIKSKAKKEGVKFNITVQDIVIPKVCPVFGTPFIKSSKLHSTSVDRVNNQRGYVKVNIQIISGLANVMKNKATPAQLLRFAEWIKKCYGPTKKKHSKL